MKKIFMMAALLALATASQSFAANDNMSYDKDTSVTARADTADSPMMSAVHHRKRLVRSKTSAHLATHSVTTNDSKTSRQGMPSGETNGPISNQSDDQNYGQPTNH